MPMYVFKAGDVVQVEDTPFIREWTQGLSAIGHTFVIDKTQADGLNRGENITENNQKYGINYRRQDLIAITRSYIYHKTSIPIDSLDEDLKEVKRMAEGKTIGWVDKSPHTGVKDPTRKLTLPESDIEKCERLAREADRQPDVKTLRQEIRSNPEPLTWPATSQTSPGGFPLVEYPSPFCYESEGMDKGAEPVLLTRSKKKRPSLMVVRMPVVY